MMENNVLTQEVLDLLPEPVSGPPASKDLDPPTNKLSFSLSSLKFPAVADL